MRISPGSPQSKWEDNLGPSNSDSVYTITLVTPMFGGGYEARQIDSERFIRESSIRGQLRFWWRATRGAGFNNVFELRKREVEIFGDTSNPSNIKVRITNLRDSKSKKYVISWEKHRIKPFPDYLFQESEEDKNIEKEVNYLEKVTFDLKLSFSGKPQELRELKKDVEAALWAWINFGGLGSRTRRGCGSLYCDGLSPKQSDCSIEGFSRWVNGCLTKYELTSLLKNEIKEWPTLNPSSFRVAFLGKRHSEAWNDVIRAYKNFRAKAKKTERFDEIKKHKVTDFGRSFWPEADSIRKTLDMAHPKHDDPTHYYESNPDKEVTAFPRAELGMPIIFHFKEVNEPIRKYKRGQKLNKSIPQEPYTTMLTPVDRERLASPLILKPLAYSPSKSIAIIVVLHHQPIKDPLKLTVVDNKAKEITYEVQMSEEELNYKNSPMLKISKDKRGANSAYSSAVDAFLNSEEVERFCRTTNMQKSQSQRTGSQNHHKPRF